MKHWLETLFFASRWLLTPFYAALALAIAGLGIKGGLHAFDLAFRFASLSQSEVILGALGFVDLTLTASLIVIVIFSGYANFVSRVDPTAHEDWPAWMASIDFSELKIKLMGSIVAISAIRLLEAYMDVAHESDRDLMWLTGLHVVFVVSTLLLAAADRLGHRAGGA